MGKLIIHLTADWEGQDFHSLKDFILLRKRIGKEIPITHFICPNYFLTDNKAAKKIRKVIFPQDEIGLHIHPLKELISHFNIPFRKEKNFYRPAEAILPTGFRDKIPASVQRFLNIGVSGRGVPLSVYNPDEIKKIIRESLRLLKENLEIENIKGFRAGGNMASDEVIKALENLGFYYDSSAFPPEILSNGYNDNNNGNLHDDYQDKNGLFTQYVQSIWGKNLQQEYFLKNKLIKENNLTGYITKTSQPFKINSLWEAPINAGMSDFASPTKTMVPTFNKLLSKAQQNNSTYFLNFGFHHEGEITFKEAIFQFIKHIQRVNSNIVEFSTISGSLPNIGI